MPLSLTECSQSAWRTMGDVTRYESDLCIWRPATSPSPPDICTQPHEAVRPSPFTRHVASPHHANGTPGQSMFHVRSYRYAKAAVSLKAASNRAVGAAVADGATVLGAAVGSALGDEVVGDALGANVSVGAGRVGSGVAVHEREGVTSSAARSLDSCDFRSKRTTTPRPVARHQVVARCPRSIAGLVAVSRAAAPRRNRARHTQASELAADSVKANPSF